MAYPMGLPGCRPWNLLYGTPCRIPWACMVAAHGIYYAVPRVASQRFIDHVVYPMARSMVFPMSLP